MTNGRMTMAVLAATAAVAAGGGTSAQAPRLDDVLERTATYVADFREQFSGIVSEETYLQEIVLTARIGAGAATTRRRMRSDLLLVKAGERYVELRDVFEVDGDQLHDNRGRLESLLKNRVQTDEAKIGDIINQSARWNIGSVTRTINTPLMALQFLDATNQRRFRFRHVETGQPVFSDARDQAANDTPVFRVSTEMWNIEYEERDRPTIIKSPGGDNRPARGRFWVNPANGSVLISELIVDSGGVIATITVSYQSEPLMGFLVPVEMRESYLRYPQRITGHATYGRFRQIK